jgi:outer membrane protein with beta-barrel domain
LEFKTRTGLHGGIFFGGNRSGVLGLQGEINWIRKRTETEPSGRAPSNQAIRIDYLQVPVLLRLNAGTASPSGFALYGIAGPAVDIKIADEIEGVTIDDGFEGADVSLVFGGGVEVARIIVEGRYEKGLRQINKNFIDFTEIKKQAFTILFGIRFN